MLKLVDCDAIDVLSTRRQSLPHIYVLDGQMIDLGEHTLQMVLLCVSSGARRLGHRSSGTLFLDDYAVIWR